MAETLATGGIVTFTVKVNGSAIPDEFQVFSIRVEKKVNHISLARIVILDGSAETGTFAASSSDTLVPGAQISIGAGYDGNNTTLFKGIITGQTIRIDEAIGSALEVECRDEAIKMTVGRKCHTWSKQKDSDILTSIIGAYPGLSAEVASSMAARPEQVQYYVTDWDFMISLAEANGMIATTEAGKVSVFKPGAVTTPVLTVSYGDGLLAFNASLNAITQLGNVKANAWNYSGQTLISAEVTDDVAGPGNLSTKKLSQVAGSGGYTLQTSASVNGADLDTWAGAQITKSEYAKIRGDARFQGSALVQPGKYITLGGLGDRFNGDHLVSGVTHSISNGNWVTEASVGLSPDWFIEKPELAAPTASGLLPGVKGLFSAIVKQIYGDPDNQFRILVDIPAFDTGGAGIWARPANFYATNGAGAFFLPEVGDEVVIGFMNEDPRFPIILGSMYSSPKLKPPFTPDQKNSTKAIVSKSGISVKFDDEKKAITINTPGNNTMVMSDDAKQITIQDQHSNSIVMSAEGITIKSPGNISFQADQQISLNGTQGIIIQSAGGDVNVSGLNIKEKAQMQYSAEGGMTAEVSGGMQLTLKSAMIMIN